MKEFVLGFLFDPDNRRVALIRKLRPEWQAGQLNGLGGRIEPGETPRAAMIREFREESGALVEGWDYIGELEGPDWKVHVFRAFRNSISIWSPTDETVAWYDFDKLPENVISNLRWMIPFALHDNASARFAISYDL